MESLAGTVKRLNVEHRTPNIERSILMTLRFIYFKTSEPQNTEPQPATSFPRRARGLSLPMTAESNFEGQLCFDQFFIKLTEYIIRCWTFNVDGFVKSQIGSLRCLLSGVSTRRLNSKNSSQAPQTAWNS